MSYIAAAVIVGGAALGGAYLSSQAAGSAAGAQVQGDQLASQTQLHELQAQLALQTPGRNLGYGADALLAQLYGLPNPNANSTTNMYPSNSAAVGALGGGGPTGAGYGAPIGPGGQPGLPANAPPGASAQFSNFYNAPGYQFTLNQGTTAINRAAAARGDIYAPQTLNALGTFAEGTASNQYNNYVQQLMGLAGIGGTAVAGSSSALQNAGNNISANNISAGNANASGILGSGSAFSGAINSAGGALGNYSMLSNYNTNGYNPNYTPQVPQQFNGGFTLPPVGSGDTYTGLPSTIPPP